MLVVLAPSGAVFREVHSDREMKAGPSMTVRNPRLCLNSPLRHPAISLGCHSVQRNRHRNAVEVERLGGVYKSMPYRRGGVAPIARRRPRVPFRHALRGLDSNAVDPLIDLPRAYETLRAAVDDGRLRLLFTHVTIDEFTAVSDVDRRSRLLLAVVDLGQLVPTGACVADVSRVNFARVIEDVDAVDALRSGNIDHTRDALIAATAIFEKCALVTNDKRLAARARERGIEVITTRNLLADYGFAQAA